MNATNALCVMVLLMLLASCTPLAPIQAGTTAAVMVENWVEDPEQDEEDQSLVEGIDDVLSGPRNILNAGLAADTAFFWSLRDLISGNGVNYKKLHEAMSRYFPVVLSSPSAPPRQLLPSEMPGSPFAMKK